MVYALIISTSHCVRMREPHLIRLRGAERLSLKGDQGTEPPIHHLYPKAPMLPNPRPPFQGS